MIKKLLLNCIAHILKAMEIKEHSPRPDEIKIIIKDYFSASLEKFPSVFFSIASVPFALDFSRECVHLSIGWMIPTTWIDNHVAPSSASVISSQIVSCFHILSALWASSQACPPSGIPCSAISESTWSCYCHFSFHKASPIFLSSLKLTVSYPIKLFKPHFKEAIPWRKSHTIFLGKKKIWTFPSFSLLYLSSVMN